MHRERDSRGISVSRGIISIPKSRLTLSRPRSATPSTGTRFPLFTGRHRILEVHRYEIQPRDSPTSSIEAAVEQPTSPTEVVTFLSSTGEQLLGKELEVPSEEEQEIYSNIPLVEEQEEVLDNPIIEPYISSVESTMAGEGEVHDVNGELRIGGGWGRGGNIGGAGRKCGRGGRGEPNRYGFPIFDEDTTTTIKNISPFILPNFHGLGNEGPKTFLFEFQVLRRPYDYLLDT